jgi:hypothetical protein
VIKYYEAQEYNVLVFIPRESPTSGSPGDHSLRVCIPFSINRPSVYNWRKKLLNKQPHYKKYDIIYYAHIQWAGETSLT